MPMRRPVEKSKSRERIAVVPRTHGVLVGLLALRAPRGWHPQDLGPARSVRPVRSHPCPASGVRGAQAPRLDRDHGCLSTPSPRPTTGSARRRSALGSRTRRCVDGCAISDAGPRHWRCPSPLWRSSSAARHCDRVVIRGVTRSSHESRLEGGVCGAGMAGDVGLALLLGGVRRRARRHQHELPLSHRRQRRANMGE